MAVLNNAGDDQPAPRSTRNLDRFRSSLLRMNSTEEKQVVSAPASQCELFKRDAVINSRHVIELRMSVRIADRDVVAATIVFLVDRHDSFGGKTVNRGDNRSLNQTAVSERQKIEMIVNQIELASPLEHFRDVQRLPYFGIHARVFRVRSRADRDESGSSNRICSREQRDVDAALDQALSQKRDNSLPRSVVPRQYSPGNWRQHRDSHKANE